jgi:predicted Zn-dependent protease
MTNGATYLDGISTVYLVNSKGFSGNYDSTFTGAFLMAMAADENDRAVAFGLGVSTKWADIDAGKIGQEAGERAAKLLGGHFYVLSLQVFFLHLQLLLCRELKT